MALLDTPILAQATLLDFLVFFAVIVFFRSNRTSSFSVVTPNVHLLNAPPRSSDYTQVSPGPCFVVVFTGQLPSLHHATIQVASANGKRDMDGVDPRRLDQGQQQTHLRDRAGNRWHATNRRGLTGNRRPTNEEDSAGSFNHHLMALSSVPTICSFDDPSNPVQDQKELFEFRNIRLEVQTIHGEGRIITATMDTGATCNAMSESRAKLLGFVQPFVQHTSEIMVIGGARVTPLGTANLSFRLPCDKNDENPASPADFYILRDSQMAGHSILLCASLTKQLHHLERSNCPKCAAYVVQM